MDERYDEGPRIGDPAYYRTRYTVGYDGGYDSALNSEEPDRNIRTFSGTVTYDNETDAPPVVGQIDGVRIPSESLSDWDACDAYSDDAIRIAASVWNFEADHWREELEKLDRELQCGPLLFIRAIHLEPAHRGHDVGLWLVRHAIETFMDSDGIVVLEASPFLVRNGDKLDPPPDMAGVQKKLASYWKRAGFQPFPPPPKFIEPTLVHVTWSPLMFFNPSRHAPWDKNLNWPKARERRGARRATPRSP